MKNFAYNVSLSLFAILFVGGCTIHYVPDPTTYEVGEIDEFVSADSINLINDQPFSDNVKLFGGIYGNFQQWTDVAINLTKTELSKRGMTIINSAQKKLKLSIVDAKMNPYPQYTSFETALRVETGGGYANTYVEKAGSALSGYHAIDASFIRAVTAMLRDPAIVKYLTK